MHSVFPTLPRHHIDAIVLHRVVMPMRSAFAASHGVEQQKHATIVEVQSGNETGWGECAALQYPTYTDEFADGAYDVLNQLSANAISGSDWRNSIAGNQMAKAGLDMALLDLDLRKSHKSLATFLRELTGSTIRTHVPAGLSIGIVRERSELLSIVQAAVEQGYQRVRIKIDRGFDYTPIARIRKQFPSLPIQVDANGAYSLGDVDLLKRLDDLELLMIEQPLPSNDLEGHAQLAKHLRTPLCLDEPIVSAQHAEHALELKACSAINIKVARLGGIQETIDTLTVCRSKQAAAWCGGMLDTGIGRAVNVAIASLDGFTSPGDIAATDRYFANDLIASAFVVQDGCIRVPDSPGIGVEIDRHALRAFTTRSSTVTSHHI
jgi:o-succinylbenzoate synthase